MARKRLPVDEGDAIERYTGGESCKSIAQSYGVSDDRIKGILGRAGVPWRGMSEARRVMWANRSPEERLVALANAHAATEGRMGEFARRAKGVKKSSDYLEDRAATRHRTGSEIGYGEEIMRCWLLERGLVFEPQVPVDKYNLDLALAPVAVEIHVTPQSPLYRTGRGALDRIEYLTNRGWHVIYVWVTKAHFLSPQAADDVIAFYERAKADPSTVGEYRVIRGSGELVAVGRGDLDGVTRIPTPRSAKDSRNGQPIESLPRWRANQRLAAQSPAGKAKAKARSAAWRRRKRVDQGISG